MTKYLKSSRKTQRIILLISVFLMSLVSWAITSSSTPPEYKTFGRDQRINYLPEERDLMRIWIVYVGQGDGILIQLPEKYNYDPSPDDNIEEKSERLDIMIDGGSSYSRNKTRMLEFLQSIYTESLITIEHAVITHHDKDHIFGLITILNGSTIAVQNIYHNGLASYRPTESILNDIRNSSGAIVLDSLKNIKRVIASLESDRTTLKRDYLICFGSAKFGQMRAFLKLQIICDNLKLGEMHDNQSKVQNFA